MNSVDVLNILNDIEATKSRTEKEAILERVISDDLVQSVVKAAYDPFITYGLTPPKVETEGKDTFDAESRSIWALLYSLQTRNVTGGKAFELVKETMFRLNAPSAELLWRILSKDLRCGITEKTVNKLIPGTIPTFDVMLAHKFEEKRIKAWPVCIEPKLDGVRVICLVKDGTAKFFSRTGKPFPALEHLGPETAAMVANAIDELDMRVPTDKLRELYRKMMANGTLALDGEMVSGSFNETSGAVRRKNEAALDAEFHVFDAIPYGIMTGQATEFRAPYNLRREFVRYIVDRSPTAKLKKTERYFANSAEELQTFYQQFRDRGLEGAIVKPSDGIYSKKRSHAWLKMKNEDTEDLRVIGAFEGTGKYEGKLGGLVVRRDLMVGHVDVRVGGGFSDAQREEFWEAWLHDERLADEEPELAGVESELLGRLIEVEYHEVTPDGSLRHPRFIRFRDDKDEKFSTKEAA